MLITLPRVSVKTPKSVIEVRSNNISHLSARGHARQHALPHFCHSTAASRSPPGCPLEKTGQGGEPALLWPWPASHCLLLSVITLVICGLGEPPFTSAPILARLQVHACCH